jgi:hypothetical protein
MLRRVRFEGLQLTVHLADGPVSSDEIQESYEGSYRDGILPYEIWDFSAADVDGLDLERMGMLLSEVFPRGTADERTAFVVGTDDQRETAELFQRMAAFQDFPPEIRVFLDLSSAVHWLFGGQWQSALNLIQPTLGDSDNSPS